MLLSQADHHHTCLSLTMVLGTPVLVPILAWQVFYPVGRLPSPHPTPMTFLNSILLKICLNLNLITTHVSLCWQLMGVSRLWSVDSECCEGFRSCMVWMRQEPAPQQLWAPVSSLPRKWNLKAGEIKNTFLPCHCLYDASCEEVSWRQACLQSWPLAGAPGLGIQEWPFHSLMAHQAYPIPTG